MEVVHAIHQSSSSQPQTVIVSTATLAITGPKPLNCEFTVVAVHNTTCLGRPAVREIGDSGGREYSSARR